MPHYTETDGLDQYCKTDYQRRVIETVRKENTIAKAATKLGIHERNVHAVLKRIRQYAATKDGVAFPVSSGPRPPLEAGTPGTSTLVDADGNLRLQWIKAKEDAQTAQQAAQAVRDALLESLPRERAAPAKKGGNDADLLNLYVLTDYHIGMRAWPEETGAAWDTAIAEDMLVRWFQTSIKQAPPAEVGVFAQLGDFLHWDGVDSVTPQSKHVLDADTRYQKLIRVAIRVIRRIVRMLLQKHGRVHLIMAEGNHDPAGSMWLREMFSAWYDDDPRVTVDTSPDPFYAVQHGDVSLFFHHGHKRSPANVDHVMAAKFREMFGSTRFSYAHLGHLHHNKLLETSLMHVEQHQTLAAPDAYASNNGWMSGRSAKVQTYHKQYGRVAELTITPEMIQ